MKKRVIFINSHPIQYFAPMYKYMNETGVKTSCWYCSNETLQGKFDQEFGVEVKWDIPLLDGYDYKFFTNQSWKPSHNNGFFGLINLGMLRELFRIPKSVIVVHGYHYFTLFCLLVIGKIPGHTMCLRCDVPYKHEYLKNGYTQKIKQFIFSYILFPRINYFLYVGEQNRMFYKSYGVSDSKLLSCPYAVDNKRFQNEFAALSNHISSIKEDMGIPSSDKVIIFSAKYITKKRPLDILLAFSRLNVHNIWLIMIGEGDLRPDMEALIATQNIQNVILTGFVNQSRISDYYVIGDVFVMCSGLGENWGLSANEAMNFNLPLILSDLSGCADDLVKEGVNGYTFKTGDIADLTAKLEELLLHNALTKATSSLDIIFNYSYERIVANINVLV